jgi:histidine triad (HIT) family protein
MPTTASDCLFCQIATRQVPADIIHASDNVVAFRDINPQAPTHILLIPKDHIASAAELEEGHKGILAELFASAAHLARASVQHLHFHLLGGRAMRWPPG